MYKLFKRTHHPGILEVQMAGACDPGIARDHNEDAIALQEDDGRGYFFAIVCDGMGGHNAGEVASAIAVETIAEYLAQHFAELDPVAILERSFATASARIDAQAEQNPDARGMGCTAVMVLGIKDRLYVAHAGDSRAYRLRDGQLEAISRDHTMVQEMLDSGLITKEQAAVHPYRGRISRCLGHGKNKGDPTITEHILEPGDNILLCSDGLCDVVPEAEIAALVGQRDVRGSCRRLVEAANKAGGPDNISAIVMRRLV
jgi:protein phosphatase